MISTRSISRWVLSGLTGAALLVLLIFREPLLVSLGNALIVSEPLEKADIIYVLAGDFLGSRVLVGADLGTRGYANKVVMSGGAYQDSYQGDLAIRFAVKHGYARNLFIAVRHNAKSTIDEALVMGPVFEQLGAKHII